MRSKIIIHLGPKVLVPIDLSFLIIPKGKLGIVKIIDLLYALICFAFLPGIMIWEPMALNLGGNLTLVVFATIILLLTLTALRGILTHQDLLKAIPYDIPMLFFTTIVAMSLFTGTALLRNTKNIWGGMELRSIAGVTLIGFWFLYYFLTAKFQEEKSLQNALVCYWLAPIVALLFWLLTFNNFIPSQIAIFSLLLPASTWLFLTQSKHRILHGLNMIIAIVFLFISEDNLAILISIVGFLISFLTIIFVKRNSLAEMFKGLDVLPKKRSELFDYINRNVFPIFMLIATLVIIGGAFWIKGHINPYTFAAFTSGTQLINFPSFVTLILGNGLNTIAASTGFKFISVYGALPVLAFFVGAFFIIRSFVKAIKKTSSIANKGLLISIFTNLVTITSYLLLAANNSELLVVIFLINIVFIGLLTDRILNKQTVVSEIKLRAFTKIKGKKMRIVIQVIQYLLMLLVICAAIYLLSSLNYINIFLVSN